MNALYADIGCRIAQLRHENHLTQAQLAEKLDVSIKHMSECERGVSCFALEKLILLCDILYTDLDYLIRGVDHRTTDAANVPGYVLELFNSDDETQKQLLQEYLLLFKKTYGNK